MKHLCIFLCLQAKNGLLVEEDIKLVAKLLKTQVMALIRDRDERRKAQMLTSEYSHHQHNNTSSSVASSSIGISTNIEKLVEMRHELELQLPNFSSTSSKFHQQEQTVSTSNASNMTYNHDSSNGQQ